MIWMTEGFSKFISQSLQLKSFPTLIGLSFTFLTGAFFAAASVRHTSSTFKSSQGSTFSVLALHPFLT
jgi:hypothetical protein